MLTPDTTPEIRYVQAGQTRKRYDQHYNLWVNGNVQHAHCYYPNATICAQVLYDTREEDETISGYDLALLLEILCGDLAPYGSYEILTCKLIDFLHRTEDPDLSQFVQDCLTR